MPLASDASGELGTADTIVERLDDAAFNKSGVARNWDGMPETPLPGRTNFDATGNKLCADSGGASSHGVY